MNAPNSLPPFSMGSDGSAMLMTCEICARPQQSRSVGDLFRCSRCGGPLKPPTKAAPRRSTSLVVGLLILAAGMAAVAARTPIVRIAPAAARVYAAIGVPVNLRGVAFDDLHTSIVEADGRRVLTVEGALVNLRDQKVETTDMRIALRDAQSHEIYVWTAHAPKTALEPREQTSFRLRLASPPSGAQEVMVRFASASDKRAAIEDGL
jgi:hypothetical protein